MMTFGNRLTSIRKERKVSQSDLGIKAGVHANLIGRYERDEAIPSVEVAGKISDALSVSLDYLVGKADMQIDQNLLDKVHLSNSYPMMIGSILCMPLMASSNMLKQS